MAFISEEEALRTVFPKDIRPSLKCWQRYRREMNLPHYAFQSRVIYDLDELLAAVKKIGKPSSEA